MTEVEKFEYAVIMKRKKFLDAKPALESEDSIDWNDQLCLFDVADLGSVIRTLQTVKGFLDGH